VISRRLFLGSGVAATFVLPAQAAPPARPARPLVILDPGHGGKDPGAIGISGTYEKHVALAAAQELQRQLRVGGRMRVELTRTRDVFIPLPERVAIAQRKGAALFVSMHADALLDHTVRGASVYTLGDHASDAQTAALASRENASDRFAAPGIHDTPPEVARILASLVREETRAGSARMARQVVGSLGQDTRLLPNPSRQAGFVVLKAADIPSVLVEMGFMSNREDEAALRQAGHRARVAGAIKRAIEAYFAALPNA
jgi:N-acetylmuramoyl-L-alanine amidase